MKSRFRSRRQSVTSGSRRFSITKFQDDSAPKLVTRRSSMPSQRSSSTSLRSSIEDAIRKAKDTFKNTSFLHNSDSKRGVRFGSIEIREYKMAIIDNPACKFGPPLTLDWEYEVTESMPVNEYEKYFHSRNLASHQEGIRLSISDREKILKASGFTSSQIRKELEQINMARVKRIREARAEGIDKKWFLMKVI